VLASDTSTSLEIRSATDADWPAISLLDATSFGMFGHPESLTSWRSMMSADSTVLACDGRDVVGMAHYLDMLLTVPGGAVLPTAGITIVGVAPTHRRRGILRAMYTELHNRIADAGYPIAGLTASEGGIYGRFGYGPATIEQEFSVDRRLARFRDDAPDPGGVRMDLDVLGSMYLGAHKTSSYARAKRLHTNDSGLLARLEAGLVSDVPAVLGYGF
jgi:predicted acetyltransferase